LKQKTLETLKVFGLNEEESKAYLSLLESGALTVTEVSDIAEIPRSKTYGVLKSLSEKGTVTTYPGRPLVYRAVQPEAAFKSILVSRTKEYLSDIEKMKNAKVDLLVELEPVHKSGAKHIEPKNVVWTLKGRTTVYNHLAEYIRGARKNIVSICAPRSIRKLSELELFIEPFKAAHERGVKFQAVAPITKDILCYAEALSDVCELRHIDNTYARFYVFDEKRSIILTDTAGKPGQIMGLWSENDEMAKMLTQFFTFAWERAEPFSERMAKLKTET